MNLIEATAAQGIHPSIPGMAMEPGIDPATPLGRLLGISSKLMDGLWFCPAVPPSLCKELVQTSQGHNRGISHRHTSLIADIMKSGNWCKRTGWAIHFHKEGWLANGQHRLLASAKAELPFYALIYTGLGNREVGSLDQGRKRAANDILAISFGGVENATNIAAAARAKMQYLSGDMRFGASLDVYGVCEMAAKFTKEEQDIVSKCAKCAKELGLLASVTAGIMLVWYDRQPERAITFLDKVASGLTTDSTDPAYLFRQYTITRKSDWMGKGRRWNRGGFGQILIRAVNIATSGVKREKLQASKGDTKVDLLIAPVLQKGLLMDTTK